MAEGLRLDVALVQRDLVKSRTRAKSLIENGHVLVNGKVCKKSSFAVLSQDHLQVDDAQRFVSRGGYKLLKAIETFSISIHELNCIDVGASTGGFTDEVGDISAPVDIKSILLKLLSSKRCIT